MATAFAYEVETDIPLPDRQVTATKYPFGEMKVGDSFLADESDRGRLANAATMHAKRHGGKFSIRKITADSIRVWRTA